MDAKYLAEIKAREQAATPGPWEMENEPKGSGFFGTIHGKAGVSFSGNRADNEFIAHARTDIPELIAEVERLTQENSSLEKEYRHYIRLSEKLDQQIVTLKKALQIVFTEFGRYLPNDMDFYIQQAQEQEGHDG